jgi:hypothetical protein
VVTILARPTHTAGATLGTTASSFAGERGVIVNRRRMFAYDLKLRSYGLAHFPRAPVLEALR